MNTQHSTKIMNISTQRNIAIYRKTVSHVVNHVVLVRALTVLAWPGPFTLSLIKIYIYK